MKSCPFCSLHLTLIEIGGRSRLGCVSCEFVHWDNPKPVTATVIEMNGGIVLVKRKFEPFVGDWCLPGGFMEAAEHPAEAARREVLEETGLLVNVGRVLDAGAPGRGINVVIIIYEAIAVGGELIAGDDASDVGVFGFEELPHNIAFEMHRKAILTWFGSKRGAAI